MARYTLAEQEQFTHLRAIEWSSEVSFVAMGISTPFLLFVSPLLLVVTVFALNFVWAFLSESLVSIKMADFFVWLNKLKWLTAPLTSLVLITQHHSGLAIVALLWPLIVMLVGVIHKPAKIGLIQTKMLHQFPANWKA